MESLRNTGGLTRVSLLWFYEKVHKSPGLHQVHPSSWRALFNQCASLHQCLNSQTPNMANKKTEARWDQDRTWLKWKPTRWSPAGELRWAEYHFVNVPLELLSLSCINLCSLPALVERGDAFMFRRSSDLHSAAALFTPYISSPAVSHRSSPVLCDCYWSPFRASP